MNQLHQFILNHTKSASRWKSILILRSLLVNLFKFLIYLELTHAFKLYDSDKNGTMCATEFKKVLVDLGKRDITDAQVQKMLQDVDKNGDSVICWNEFLEVSVKKVFKDIDV